MKTLTLKQQVILETDGGNICGVVTHNHTGNELKKVMIEFIHNGKKYTMPFSRKSGYLFNQKLDFNVKLIV